MLLTTLKKGFKFYIKNYPKYLKEILKRIKK